jgi:hypothetical protein
LRNLLATFVSFAVSAAAVCTFGASAPSASAAGNNGSATGLFVDFGESFPGQVPPNCPSTFATDIFGLKYLSGNTNPTGATIEGTAQLVDETQHVVLYTGHSTLWGNNNNFTTSYHGTNPSGGTVDFHLVVNRPHGPQVANISCS